MSIILEIEASVGADARAGFAAYLPPIIQNILNLPGCFFKTCEIFDRQPESLSIQFRLSSDTGLDQYLSRHHSTAWSGVAAFNGQVTLTQRTYIQRGETMHPTGISAVANNGLQPENNAFGRKKQVSGNAYDGAVGIKSSAQPALNTRFDDGKQRFGNRNPLSGDGPIAGVSSNQAPSAKTGEARFFDGETQRRKPQATDFDGSLGVSTATLGARTADVRFEEPGSGFGRQHIARLEESSGTYAGVPTGKQPRGVDRFEGDLILRAPTGTASEGPVAGVTTDKQASEIDRYHGEAKQRTTIPPTEDGSVAGVITGKQVTEIDRYHGEIKVRSTVAPNGDGSVAGVVTSMQPGEIDRYHTSRRTVGESSVPTGAVGEVMGGVASATISSPAPGGTDGAGIGSLNQPQAIDRYEASRRGNGRQPPGGASSFVFG